MLRQQLQPTYKQEKNFEDQALYKEEEERIPLEQAVGWSAVSHGIVFILFLIVPVILLFLGFNLELFKKPQAKVKDIEFVLVTQPEKEPINKNTPLRADRNTQAGGIHDPNKKISPPQPALPKSAPSQQAKSLPQKQQAQKKALANKPIQKQQIVQQKEAPVKKAIQKAPSPPKPTAKPSIPPTKAPTGIKLPIPPTKGIPKIATTPSGPVSTKPKGNYGGNSSGTPKPIIASGGYGSTGNSASNPSSKGTGRGSAYSPGGGNVGNPGPGNPKGAAGVDAIKEPNFGPYMSELSRRIKANWDPPRGDESKRVVLLFKIAKDGRLLNVKVVKSSGTPAADKAALAAVELTAPFRPLPVEFRGSNIDIQFTFDYNVFGVNSSRF